ncbi:MAG: hypothetical protein ACFE0J_25745 [Elainellaceae cyanobacterium]
MLNPTPTSNQLHLSLKNVNAAKIRSDRGDAIAIQSPTHQERSLQPVQ